MTKQLLKTLLLAVLMLWGTASHAQVLLATDFNEQVPAGTCDSIFQQSWNTSSSIWETDSIQKANLNSNNYLSNILAYDPANNTLIGGMYFTRNTNEQATKLEVKLGSFVVGDYTASYDANGLLIEQIGKQVLPPTFLLTNFERLVLAYDGNDNLTEMMRYAWDGTQWVDNYRYTYSYNTSNERTGYIAELYNGTTYENETRVTYTYTTTGKVETELVETWNGTGWDISSRLTRSYNSSDEEERTLTEAWTGAAWENDELDSMFSDGTGITYDWDGSAWNPIERTYCAVQNNPPSAPNTLVASAASHNQVNMSWDHFDNTEDGFIVQRSDDGTNWSTIDSTGTDQLTYQDKTVAGGNTYYYRVAAYNQYGVSGWSNFETVNTPAAPAPPSDPTGLVATAISNTRIDLAWTDNSNNEDGFVIQRSLNKITGWAVVDTAAPNAISYSNTGLSPVTKYYYRLHAYNAGGLSAHTNIDSATTLQTTIPDKPTNLQAAITGANTVQLTWDDNSNNEDGFYIYRSDDNTIFDKIDSTGINVASYNDADVVGGNTYYYQITAYNSAGESTASNTVQADVPVSIPAAPSNLQATITTNSEVQLNWDDNSGNETGFYIYRSEDSIIFNKIDSTDENVADYLDSIVAEGNTYYYYVTAYNSAGESVTSDTVQADLPVGIADKVNSLVSLIYPNPAVNSVALQFTNDVSSQVQVRVFDLTGKAVITKNVSLQGNMHTLDVSSLAPSNYVIEVRAEDMRYTGKIIKR